jgi:hypothetical protein
VKLSTFSKLAAKLSTLEGFPAWSDTMSENYFTDTQDIPEAVAALMVQGVGRQFDKRPSAKLLRDWAGTLTPQKTFRPAYLSQVDTPGRRPALQAPNGASAFPVACVPPQEAKDIMARIKARVQAEARGGEEGSTEYGLQFEILPGFMGAGRISRTCPSGTRPVAEKAAAERNARWPHQHTTVFHVSDPLPQRGRGHMVGLPAAIHDGLAQTELSQSQKKQRVARAKEAARVRQEEMPIGI